ncbi:MAG TPA: alkaline phosphatase D family protein [Vicinamibacterales bacterium]|nr:alkaline phosphatase D family protein [Vicinamibacterales bacterium]
MSRSRLDRRTFLRRLGTGAAVLVARPLNAQAPGIVAAPTRRPVLPQGVAAGDVQPGRATIWSRADRPARMIVEYSTTERFEHGRRVTGPAALESSDFTARVLLRDLPEGQRIFYRVQFQDLSDLRTWSEPVAGSFMTPPSERTPRPVTIAWSADTVGQGWGINPEWGGLKLYQPMLAAEPDVFVHCGDTIYADQHLPAEIALDDGGVWRNVVTPAKSKVAETLDEFRGNYQYNLLDEDMRRFNARVAQVVIWDDHEVRNNWYPTADLAADERYTVKSVALLAARARQAFLEYHPISIDADDLERIHRVVPYGHTVDIFGLDLRSYRGANSANRQPAMTGESAILGRMQLEALKARLAASRATWKIVASDMPVGLVVRDGASHFEAVANGDPGAPLGRELEIADLLRFIRDRRIRNVVWITGDVHYCAAHHYDPARARFTGFDAFWEFVAGPLHAGTYGPGTLDPTFGPEARFIGIPKGMKPNRPPSDGLQFFGTLTIDARGRTMTVRLYSPRGVIYTQELVAE